MTQYEMQIRRMHEAMPEEKRRPMQKEHLLKKQFVEGVLSDCLCTADYGIRSLIYELILSDEIVTIRYEGGGTKSAFVTGDSKLAIIEDVMKVVY